MSDAQVNFATTSSSENETNETLTQAVEAEVVSMPKPKIKREKKPRARKFRETTQVKKWKITESEKLVQVDAVDSNFLISFPESDIARVEEGLKAIPECSMWHRTQVGPPSQNNDPAQQVELPWKQIWRVRKTEETLKLVAAFARKYKFDAVGDILMQAQLSTSDAKDLEKMSYAKACNTLRMPRFPKWTKREWAKYQFGGDYVKNIKPYPFQVAGVNYAQRTKKCFIADEMGLGKTIQALIVMRMSRRWPWLIVVPAGVKINWYRETRKWLGKNMTIGLAGNHQLTPLKRSDKKVPYTDSQKKKFLRAGKKWLNDHDVVIVNYDRVRKYLDYLQQIEWAGLVFDESHYCKGPSDRQRACLDLAKECDKAEYVLMLTGTPFLNNPVEIIRPLQIMDRIQEFGGPMHFERRYCSVTNVDMSKLPKLPKPTEDGEVGPPSDEEDETNRALRDAMVRKMYENQIELNTQLRSLCYVRREKTDVLKDLPEKTRQTILLDINNRKLYDRVERDVISFLMDRAEKDEKFVSKIKSLSKEDQVRRIKEHRSEIGYRSARAEALVRLEMLKQVAAAGKLDAAQEWMENVIDNGEKLVMFAHHNTILDELESRFPKGMVSVRGGMSEDRCQESIDKFQSDKKITLFLGSLKKAGVGITLTKSSTPAFMELGWNPAVHDQAEDRCHRIGQKNAVNVYYLIAKNTVEEKIARLIEKKRNVVDASAFGDPLSKSASVGNILSGLITDLTGKETTDPIGDQARRLGLEEDDEDDAPKKKSSKKSSKHHSSKKSSSKKTSKRR